MHERFFEHLGSSLNHFRVAFRNRFGCQSTLLRLFEAWWKAQDNHDCIAAILMNLSKAFDCLTPGILIWLSQQ